MMPNLKETKEFLESKLPGFKPEVALIVGSGLGGVVSAVTKPVTIPYADIPNFPKSTVAGHAGQMVCGELAGKRVLVLSGRFHLYEGRSLEEVVFPRPRRGHARRESIAGDKRRRRHQPGVQSRRPDADRGSHQSSRRQPAD